MTCLRPPGESGRGPWSPGLSVSPAPPCALALCITSALRDQGWSLGVLAQPLTPTVQRGLLSFYKSRFIYSPGSPALPGICRFLSDGVSGGKCKWNINREGIASPVSPVAAEPKVFHLFPGAQWCNGTLQKGHQEASKETSLQAALSQARLCHQGDVSCLCRMAELPEFPQHQGAQGLVGLGSGGQFLGQAKSWGS